MDVHNILCGTDNYTNYTLGDVKEFHSYLDNYLDEKNLNTPKEIFARMRSVNPLFSQHEADPIDFNKFREWRSCMIQNLQTLDATDLKSLKNQYSERGKEMISTLIRISYVYKKVATADYMPDEDGLQYLVESLCALREWKVGLDLSKTIKDRETRDDSLQAVIYALLAEKDFPNAYVVADLIEKVSFRERAIVDITEKNLLNGGAVTNHVTTRN